MNQPEREAIKARLLKLVLNQSTGTPSDLAYRLGISERTVKRFIKQIRDDGIRIRYCPSKISYIKEEEF